MLSIQYSRPSLMVARPPTGPAGIHLVGPGATAFVGYAAGGPLEQPEALHSETSFLSLFGAPRRADPLAAALRGFFRNGGRTAWVCRIEAPTPGLSVAMLHRGLESLRHIPEIALVAAPGWTTPQAHSLLLQHCESTRRLALLDTPPRLERWSQERLSASACGACFHPWLTVSCGDGESIEVPPSGHIAGLLSRLDQETGVHRAPEQEMIRDALGVGVSLTSHESRQLRAAGVNGIRDLHIRGVRLCSGVTCAPGAPDIATRRLMNLLAESVDQRTPWRSTAGNDEAARRRLTDEVSDLLRRLQASDILASPSGEETRVRCDWSNNPAAPSEKDPLVCDLMVRRRGGTGPIPLRLTLPIGQSTSRAPDLFTESG